MNQLRLKTLLGDHPVTEALKQGRIASASVALESADPARVERAPAGKELVAMLLADEINAAVTGDARVVDPRIAPVIPDVAAAAQAWRARKGAIQVNHMAVARSRHRPRAPAGPDAPALHR